MFRVGDKLVITQARMLDPKLRNIHVINTSRENTSGCIIGILDRQAAGNSNLLVIKLDKPRPFSEFSKRTHSEQYWWKQLVWFNKEPNPDDKLEWISDGNTITIVKLPPPKSYRQIFRETLMGV
jgi:hypothetical protein